MSSKTYSKMGRVGKEALPPLYTRGRSNLYAGNESFGAEKTEIDGEAFSPVSDEKKARRSFRKNTPLAYKTFLAYVGRQRGASLQKFKSSPGSHARAKSVGAQNRASIGRK